MLLYYIERESSFVYNVLVIIIIWMSYSNST